MYSQLELRILGVYSQDKNLIEQYNAGADLHKATASGAFNIPMDEVTSEQRTAAKAIAFGIVYQESPRGLSEDLRQQGIDMSEEECATYIDNYLRRFPDVNRWIKNIKKTAQREKQVTTLTGRIRRLHTIDSTDKTLVNMALRQSVNAPIQCMSPNTMILTNEGYRALKTIPTSSMTEIWDGYEWRTSRRFPNTTNKETVRIITKHYGVLEVSTDHPVYVANDSELVWKRAGNINPGDLLVSTTQNASEGLMVDIPPIADSGVKGTTCPQNVNEDVAYVIGCMIGNGNYKELDGTMHFCTSDIKVKEKFQQSLKKAFNLDVSWSTQMYKGEFSYYRADKLNSIHVRKILEKIGLDYVTGEHKRIPDALITSPAQIRHSVLKGLFDTDGSCTGDKRNGYEVSYKSISRPLVQDISLLLGSIGIFSRTFRNTEKDNDNEYFRCAIDLTSIKRFEELIGFTFVSRNERLQECLGNITLRKTRDIMPKFLSKEIGEKVFQSEQYKNTVPKIAQLRADVSNSRNNRKRVSRQVTLDLIKEFGLTEYKYLENMKFEEVMTVENLGHTELMDLEVFSEFHGLCANGYVIHNSFGSDCTLQALIQIDNWLKETNKRSVIAITVHDSIVLDCPKDEVIEVAKKSKHIMENLAEYDEFYSILGDIPIVSDLEIGYNYAEIFEAEISDLEEQGVDGFIRANLAKKAQNEREVFKKVEDEGGIIPSFVHKYWNTFNK